MVKSDNHKRMKYFMSMCHTVFYYVVSYNAI